MSLLLTSTISVIILKYFSSYSCVYHFGDLDIAWEANFEVKLSLPLSDKLLGVFDAIKCEGYFISGRNVNQTVVDIEHTLQYTSVYKFNIRRYLLVETSIGNIDVEAYFMDNAFYKLADIVLIVPRNENCLQFYSYSYAGRNNMRVVDLGILCNDTNVMIPTNLQLYRNDLGNAMGRELRVCTFNYLPYIDLSINKGAELSMVNSFIEKYNYSQLIVATKEYWGSFFPNFTGTGAQGILLSGRADLTIGCYYPRLNRRITFDCSIALLRNGLSFIVPKPELAAGITILKPFQIVPWFMMIFTLFLFAVLHYITNLNSKKYGDLLFGNFCLEMFGVLLLQHGNLRASLLGGLSLFYAFMMVAFYTSVLSSIMTKPSYDKHIRSGRDLDASDVRILAYSPEFISGIDEVAYANILRNVEGITPVELDDVLKKTNHLALAVDHLDLGFALVNYNDVLPLERLERFFLLEEDLMFDSCVALSHKNSVFMPTLNTHIQRLKETGLDYYWQAESFRNLNFRIQLYMKSAKTLGTPFTQIQIHHVQGSFIFLLVGYILSILRFGYECWLFKHKSQKGKQTVAHTSLRNWN